MRPGRHDSIHPSPFRMLALFAIAAIVGAALAALKGRGDDLAYVLGNASAPYLVVAFFVGRACRTRGAAAGMGVLTTFVALAAFYWAASALYLGRLSIDFSIARWFLVGAVSGVVLGVTGNLSKMHRWLLLIPPGVLGFEPLAMLLARLFGVGSASAPSDVVLAAAIEVAAGVVLAAILVRPLRRQRSRWPMKA